MDALGLIGPAHPWAGGVTSFTASLATALESSVRVRWVSWRPTRLLPPNTHVDVSATPAPVTGVRHALGVYDRTSWLETGRRLGSCSSLLLTLTHPVLLVPYRTIVAAYRRFGGRVVLLCHNVVAHEASPPLRWLATRVLGLADAAIVHSGAEAALARRLSQIDVHEAFHPVYPAHAEDPWPPRPAARRLLAFGYVRPYKGLEDLIAALPHIPGATLDVVGRFSRPPAHYEALARSYRVADRVRLVDEYVPDHRLLDVFAACDLVVAPYRQASQSGVVHLAYSFGRPVVATDVGGLSQAVLDGRTGLIAPPGNPRALGETINRALTGPPGRFDAGIREVVATRTWQRYAEIVLEATRSPRMRTR